jgi:uncharacterized protein
LAASIAAAWTPTWHINHVRLELWWFSLAAAIAVGLLEGTLRIPGLAVIMLYGGILLFYTHIQHVWLKRILLTISCLLCLALALHAVPGFNNMRVADHVVLSTGVAPYSLYLKL